jgi:Ricin-type beta-trefoil lectin domain/CHAP domain
MKRVMLAVKAAMVTIVLAASVTGPSLAASAATAANLTNGGEPGTCLDANSNDYPKNGDNIQLWQCNTHPEQEWTLTASGQVKNASTGMCLDANSNDYPKNGDNIQLWQCNTHPEQEWTLTASGQVKNASTGMCLDANSDGYPYNGDNIQLWQCNTHPEQEWILGSLPIAWPGTNGPGAAQKYFGYPYPDPPACTDGGACIFDKWDFDQGQCTSWVAYRLNEMNGIAFTDTYRGDGKWGSAADWGPHARALGIAVNGTPGAGSVAWYSYGHVAYVDYVNSPTSVVISEMNTDYDNGFRVRTITTSSGWPTDFIHIADRD